MTADALAFCLRVGELHARFRLRLDDELGTLHGLSHDDFRLLHLLSQAQGGRLPLAGLVRPLGLQRSAVIRQLLPLEKTGLVERVAEGGATQVVLRSAARALVREAAETAAAACADVLRDQPAAMGTLP